MTTIISCYYKDVSDITMSTFVMGQPPFYGSTTVDGAVDYTNPYLHVPRSTEYYTTRNPAYPPTVYTPPVTSEQDRLR